MKDDNNMPLMVLNYYIVEYLLVTSRKSYPHSSTQTCAPSIN